ncbi:UNVERIFIED_CONTAM: hypothetical protein FKN15_068974 [Acipenser sinensis]
MTFVETTVNERGRERYGEKERKRKKAHEVQLQRLQDFRSCNVIIGTADRLSRGQSAFHEGDVSAPYVRPMAIELSSSREFELYGIKCSKCNIGFSKNDFVMRARSKVYHIECFRCVACSRQLIPGDEFALREDGLFCRADHDVVERATMGAGDPLSPLHPARPLQMAAEPISARQPALRPHVHKQPEKTTRVRTVLNEKQLHTLRTCYNANPRPDALMKEQLVEMTGLSPRVIRVWFQNKRCKDKKRSILMKQLQQQQPNDKTNIQGMTGTPMVAASPERHDGGLQANPVEVQSYQPPWKVLSDFALQSDIDQPAFQQLVNFSEGGPGSNSTGSEVASMSSQLPDTPNSMVSSPIEA